MAKTSTIAAASGSGGNLKHAAKMKRKQYERELLDLQIELVKAQYWVTWKLSPIDEVSLDKWDDCTDATEKMFMAIFPREPLS